MSATVASAPGIAVPGAEAAAAVPADRVLDRAVPTAVALRLAVVILGLVVVTADAGTLGAGGLAGAALLLAHAGTLTLGTRRRGEAPVGARLAVGTVVSLLAVIVSGGWWSPFGAVLAIDLALTGLGRGYRHAFAAAAGAALVLLTTAGLSAPLAPATAPTTLPMLLVLAAALGGFAHGLTAGDRNEGLGHAVHLADANRLAADLHLTLRSLPTAPDAVTVSRAALDWLRERVPFTAAAVVVHEPTGDVLVHAEGSPVTDSAALVAAVPSTLAITEGAPLTGTAAATASVPLELRGDRLGLLVLELDDDAPVPAAESRRVLGSLSDPLALALDTARWFARLSTLAGELERSRLATELSDRLCQSMATTAFALDRAAVRTGDVELFTLADAVRADVGDLRMALDDLRAHVDDDPDLEVVVRGCLQRASARDGILATATLELEARGPRVVEQQVLRSLQELLGALDDATVADVRWRSDARGVCLSIRHDGRLVPPPSVHDRADAIGAALTTTAVPGGAVLTLTTEVPS